MTLSPGVSQGIGGSDTVHPSAWGNGNPSNDTGSTVLGAAVNVTLGPNGA